MTIFGCDAKRIRDLVAAVTADDAAAADEVTAADDIAPAGGEIAEAGENADAQTVERFARAAWSTIVEPGDRDAGMLVARLGAAAALAVVVDGWPIDRILEACGEQETVNDPRPRASLAAAMQRWQPRLQPAAAVRALEQAARVRASLIVPADPEWPGGVDDLGEHAPLALWWRGVSGLRLDVNPSIALVGARASTGYGEHVAMEAAAGLVDRGFAVVSGAAYGIDGMAHRAALASDGTTVAFLAGGVDRFYPSGHESLLGRIVASGAVLSELPCGAAPTRWRFLQRNRLIAAASRATVVLEAGSRSGSLNTAGHAAALGRPLGAVPGPVTSPASAGCHRLIRDFGATCVTSAAEMAELVEGLGMAETEARVGSADPTRRSADEIRVLDALSSRAPREIADVARRSGLSLSSVSAVLGLLELDGIVRERPGGWLAIAAG